MSNLRECGVLLLAYANASRGRLYPEGWGSDKPREQRWPVYVLRPAVWNPPVLRCPDDPDPAEEHSYVLNGHLARKRVRYGRPPGASADRVVWMGEKVAGRDDYYMEAEAGQTDFDAIVEAYRHGARLGSNHLYLDGHVDADPPAGRPGWSDPWDVPGGDPAEELPGPTPPGPGG